MTDIYVWLVIILIISILVQELKMISRWFK